MKLVSWCFHNGSAFNEVRMYFINIFYKFHDQLQIITLIQIRIATI